MLQYLCNKVNRQTFMQTPEPPAINPLDRLTTGKVILGVLVILSVFILFRLLIHFYMVLILVFAGVVISISIAPAVNWLHQHGVPLSLSVILIYLALVAVVLGFIVFVIPPTIQQATMLIPRFESMYALFKSTLHASPNSFLQQWSNILPASLSAIFTQSLSGGGGGKINPFNRTLSIAQSVLGGLFILFVVLLLGFYWASEGERVQYAFLLLLPADKRESARQTIVEIETSVGGFVRGQGLLAITIAVMALVAYFIVGLPSVLSLALMAGMFELVPVFGPTLGAIPAFLVAFEYNPSKILGVLVATILIQLIENHLLAPRIMQKTAGVNPIVTILSLVGFGALFGFPLLLLAIPMAAVFQVIINRSLLNPEKTAVEAPAGRDYLSKLSYEAQEFVQDVRKLVRRKETGKVDGDSDEIEDAIEAIASDLDLLLAQSDREEKQP